MPSPERPVFPAGAAGCAAAPPAKAAGRGRAGEESGPAAAPDGVPGPAVIAPSWVIPGTVAENIRFLAHKAGQWPEIAGVQTLFFETAASRRFRFEDIVPPDGLAGLACHLHLPLDLPWAFGAEAVLEAALALVEVARPLAPRSFVLHPADDDALTARFLALWAASGRRPAELLLENTRTNDLSGLLARRQELGFGVCLDMGHVLAYAQRTLIRALAGQGWSGVGMLHVYAPLAAGGEAGHAGLDALAGEDARFVRQTVRAVSAAAGRLPLVVEVFAWPELERSFGVLRAWGVGGG